MIAKNKILVIRFSSIGDIVLCTPIIRALHQQFDAEVHLLTKNSMIGVLKANPYISHFIGIDDKVEEVVDELRSEDYDVVVDLHKNIRSTKVKSYLNSEALTYNKLSFKRSLYVATKIDLLPHKSVVDRYFEAVIPLGIVNDQKGMDYFYDTNNPIISKYNGQKFIVLSLGATHATKRMTPIVIDRFLANIDEKVIVIGGKDTRALSDKIDYNRYPHVMNLVGKTSIEESAILIDLSLYIITGDSAMMHIGAALNAAMIITWGCTSKRFGFAPYYGNRLNKSIDLEKLLWCRPCSKQGRARCPLGHYNCMSHTDDDIQNAIKEVQELI